MSDGRVDVVISSTTVHRELVLLLAGYLRDLEESRRDEDTYFMEYWDCACQTIYDVAAALNIPLEEKPSKCRPVIPDSITPLGSVDVQYPSNGLSEHRQYETF